MNITYLKKTFLSFIKKMIKCPECEGLFSKCLVCQNKKQKVKVKNTKFSTKNFKEDANKELLECFRTAQYIDLALKKNMEINKSNFDIGNKNLSSSKGDEIQLGLCKGIYDINEKFIAFNISCNSDFLKECKSLEKCIRALPNKANDYDFMVYLIYKESLDLLINKRKESIKRLEEMLKNIGDNFKKILIC